MRRTSRSCPAAGRLDCYFEYDVDLLDSGTVNGIAERYIALLDVVLEHPDTTLALLREEFPTVAARPAPEAAAPRERDRPARKLKKVRRRTLDDGPPTER